MNTFDIMYWTNGRRESLEANIAVRNILCVENQSRVETEGMKREKTVEIYNFVFKKIIPLD